MTNGNLIGQGRTAEIYDWSDHQILKLFRENYPDSWAEHEFAMTRYVHETGYAVPAVADVVQMKGRKGIIFEKIDGMSMLSAIRSQPLRIKQFARLLAEVHARMHETEVDGLPSQRAELQKEIRNNELISVQQKATISNILEQLPDDRRLCHGDFHPDNLLLSSRGPVVIDWTSATQGNPLADFARTSLLMQMNTVPPGLSATGRAMLQIVRKIIRSQYSKRYVQLRSATDRQLKDWLLISATTRLNDKIASEKGQLLSLIDTLLAAR